MGEQERKNTMEHRDFNCICDYASDANDPPWSNARYLYKVNRDCPEHGEKCIHGFMPKQCEYNLCEQYKKI